MNRGPALDLATFSQALRQRGLSVTPDQVADMGRAFRLIDPASRDQVRDALRSLSISDPAQRVPFEEEFYRFFEHLYPADGDPNQPSRLAHMSAVKPVVEQVDPGLADGVTRSQTGASTLETLQTRDFADLDADQAAEAKRIVMAMSWQPSDFRTRRWVTDSRGPSPDLRKTIQRTVRPDGDLIPIVRQSRRLRQRPLVMIADISGSMEKYADMFLVFAHTAQRRLDHVEAFTFSTELSRITDDLKRRDIQSALAGVNKTVHDWSGGTKIGEALAEWNRQWSRRLARGGPIAMILSDGWDTGDDGLLRTEMARLSRSVHRVLWLNPLAARSDFRPATRGMQAVLPHVDELLPAASVRDLRGVVRLLDELNRSSHRG